MTSARSRWQVLKSDEKRLIEEIGQRVQCSKNLSCVRTGLEDLCPARSLGSSSDLVECLNRRTDCSFSRSFGYGYFCRCELRCFLARRLGM